MKVDFFIVGAPKAGTTSLYHYLNEHPEIEMSLQKEPDFFSDIEIAKQGMYYGKNRISTIEEYHQLFNDNSLLKGEASVSYLFYKGVAQKIKEYNANAKIIIMLRNPVDRAFSHYLMDYRLGIVSDSFEDIIRKKSKSKYKDLFYQQYVEVSEYANQVKEYLNIFDSNNVLILDYDNLKKDIYSEVKKVYKFLSVSVDDNVDLEKKHNTYSMPKNNFIRIIYSFVFLRRVLTFLFPSKLVKKVRSILFKEENKPKLDVETRLELNEYFKSDVKKLSEILKKDFTKWTK